MFGQGLLAALLAVFIGSGTTDSSAIDYETVQMKMDFIGDNSDDLSPTAISDNDGHFYYNGFPTNLRLKDDGGVELSDFPRSTQTLASSYKNQIESSVAPSMNGYHTILPIYLPFSGPLAIDQLPDNDEFYTQATASIQVIDIDPNSAEYGHRYPLDITMTQGADSYRPANLLQILPTLGVTLQVNTTYAAVVTSEAPVAEGYKLEQHPQLASALGVGSATSDIPGKAQSVYAPLRDFLAQQAIDPSLIMAATVWTTGDPQALLRKGMEVAYQLPQQPPSEISMTTEFPDYCVVEGKFELPLFQNGAAPYYLFGGFLDLDSNGYPAVRGTRQADFVVTIPKNSVMPATGYPHLFYHHGAGGDAYQVVDRSGFAPTQGDAGVDSPARVAGFRGWATSGLGGHLGQDHLGMIEGFGMFSYDIFQGIILRNNYLQMVWERAYFRQFLAQLELDLSFCPSADSGGAEVFRFDNELLVLMGQSLGTWTGSLQLAMDPAPFKGAIFGGVSGTWIQNLTSNELKQLGVIVGAARLLPGETIDIHHPFMMLNEWVLGSVDPAAVLANVLRKPTKTAPHVYVTSGSNDVGTGKRTQLPFLMSLGVDLAGEEVGKHPKAQLLTTMGPIVGAKQYPYPVSNNAQVPGQGTRTATVSRFINTERLDGHFVMFDLEAPKHQIGCFLEHLAAGKTPVIDEGYVVDGPCYQTP